MTHNGNSARLWTEFYFYPSKNARTVFSIRRESSGIFPSQLTDVRVSG